MSRLNSPKINIGIFCFTAHFPSCYGIHIFFNNKNHRNVYVVVVPDGGRANNTGACNVGHAFIMGSGSPGRLADCLYAIDVGEVEAQQRSAEGITLQIHGWRKNANEGFLDGFLENVLEQTCTPGSCSKASRLYKLDEISYNLPSQSQHEEHIKLTCIETLR